MSESAAEGSVGTFLLREHRYGEALAAFTDAIDADPSDAAAWAGKALALARLGHHQESLTASIHALDLTGSQPNNTDARMLALRALNSNELLLADMGRYEDALVVAEVELEYAPESALAWLSKGTFLIGLGKEEQALEAIEQALTLDDAFVPAWRAKGIVLTSLLQPHEAIVAFDRALALHPGDIAAEVGKQEARKQWWRIFTIQAAPDVVLGLLELLGHF